MATKRKTGTLSKAAKTVKGKKKPAGGKAVTGKKTSTKSGSARRTTRSKSK
jgi:hypothetical protein